MENFKHFLVILTLFNFNLCAADRIKITCKENGWYRILRSELVKIHWAGAVSDYQNIHLTASAGTIPLFFETLGTSQWTALEFYVDEKIHQKNLRSFHNHILWLSVGPPNSRCYALQAPIHPPPPDQPAAIYQSFSFPATFWDRLAGASFQTNTDFLFCMPPIPGAMQSSVSFDLPGYAMNTPAISQCWFTCFPSNASPPTIPAALYINQSKQFNFDSKSNTCTTRTFTISEKSLLSTNKNTLTLLNAYSTPSAKLYVTELGFNYPCTAFAKDDFIHFSVPDSINKKPFQLILSGFSNSNISVYQRDSARIIPNSIFQAEDSDDSTDWSVLMTDYPASSNPEYIVLTEAAKKYPESLERIRDTDLLCSADLLIVIPHDSFSISHWHDYQKRKKKSGILSAIFNLQDIDNQFSFGYPHPSALQKWLAAIHQTAESPPRFLWLIGSSQLNPLTSPEQGNLCPGECYHTVKYGAAASDFALVHPFPQLSAGRLPARSVHELKNYLEKIERYTNYSPAPWMNRFVSIVSSSKIHSFTQQSETLIQEIIPAAMENQRFYVSQLNGENSFNYSREMQNLFTQGALFYNYRGHGGNTVWAHADLLNRESALKLENQNRLPFIISLTCFTANYASSSPCLGSTLCCQPFNGAIVFLGATGYGWVDMDFNFAKLFYQILFSNRNRPVGALIRETKNQLIDQFPGALAKSTAHHYALLGDPSLILHLPANAPSMEYQPQGQLIRPEPLSPDSHLDLCAIDSSNTIIWQQHFQAPFPQSIPLTLPEHVRAIRQYQYNPQTHVHSHGLISLNPAVDCIDSVIVCPQNPDEQDSIQIALLLKPSVAVESVSLEITSPFQKKINMIRDNETQLWQIPSHLPPFTGGTCYHFHFVFQTVQTSIQSTEYTQIIQPENHLEIGRCFMCGSHKPLLCFPIENKRQRDFPDIFFILTCPKLDFEYRDTLRIKAGQRDTLRVPIFAPPGIHSFSLAFSDSRTSHSIQACKKNAAITHFAFTPELGTQIGPNQHGQVGLPDKIMFMIEPKHSEKTGVISFSEIPSDKPASFKIRSSLSMQHPVFKLFLKQPPPQSLPLIPYFFNKQQQWAAVNHSFENGWHLLESDNPGLYCLDVCTDTIPPMITIHHQQKLLNPGCNVQCNPQFIILLQDQSGLNLSEKSLRLLLNDCPADKNSISMPSSLAGLTSVSLNYLPQLKQGSHTLSVSCMDIHGNMSKTVNLPFHIKSGLSFEMLGNFPNPFKHKTVFALTVSGDISKITIDIYTPSGRKIRQLKSSMPVTDYFECPYDGLDKWGCELPNGIYFYEVIVKGAGQTRRYIGKLAKIR